MSKKKSNTDSKKVLFTVRTVGPLPMGQQVFISGGLPALGNWDADGLALTRMDDNCWSAQLQVPAGQQVAYKITRGSWSAEEVTRDDCVPADYSFVVQGEDVQIDHLVHHWKDHLLGPVPQITGEYRVHDEFPSQYLVQDRKVIVWLPPSYFQHPERNYPVLYLQDGQQMFDPKTSTWGQDWEVDEWCQKLMGENRMREIIAVAVYSTFEREEEYQPSFGAKKYLNFLLKELKPFIDKTYRTCPDREDTAIAGSSLGGTLAFFAAWHHPDTFFGAACLSPAFDIDGDRPLIDAVRSVKKPPDLRLYLYSGLGDSLECQLAVGTAEMAKKLKAAGFKEGKNLQLCEDAGGKHNEASWARHTDHWLLYLFGK